MAPASVSRTYALGKPVTHYLFLSGIKTAVCLVMSVVSLSRTLAAVARATQNATHGRDRATIKHCIIAIVCRVPEVAGRMLCIALFLLRFRELSFLSVAIPHVAFYTFWHAANNPSQEKKAKGNSGGQEEKKAKGNSGGWGESLFRGLSFFVLGFASLFFCVSDEASGELTRDVRMMKAVADDQPSNKADAPNTGFLAAARPEDADGASKTAKWREYVLFYAVFYLENLFMVLMWHFLTEDRSAWYHYCALGGCLLAIPLHLSLLVLSWVCQPRPQNVCATSNSTHRLIFPNRFYTHQNQRHFASVTNDQ
jgi:hypothetical protein